MVTIEKMKKICLQEMGEDAVPRITENSFYPDIDNTYTVLPYQGKRLVVQSTQNFGFKKLGDMQSSKQGLAIYGDILVRMANVSTSTTHIIYRIRPTGILEQVATFTNSSVGHSNALQFAPTLEDGQTLPYLYVANLDNKCTVLSIGANYAVSVVQVITISATNAGGNILIGDDGYIWSVSLNSSNNHYHFVKFRKVLVSEGNVTLTDSDILDEWETTEEYPYSIYVWQGMMIKFGKIWFVFGQTTSGTKRGIAIYDTATHALVTIIDLNAIEYELEDLDTWEDSIILATYSSPYYILKF